MKASLRNQERFEARHNNAAEADRQAMLKAIGVDSIETLINQTVPAAIRLKAPLNLPAARSEHRFLSDFHRLAGQNKIFRSYLGMGYYDTHTPNVILRNILENPGWYTAYTPYQAEIAQGRLEMLLNFQTLVSDLTGLPVANASLLDEATAAAEAMTLLFSLKKGPKATARVFFVDENTHPQTLDVLRTRATPLGIGVESGPIGTLDLTRPDLFGLLLSYPGSDGSVQDFTGLIASARELEVRVAVATDLLALTLLKSPGEMGADVAVGTAQRLGVPMGYGGPHAAFFATRDDYKRQLPGRIIGLSQDAQGNPALRMALQTREQHIRREKATSNICTAQVLLAVMAAAYAVYHGPEGLRAIAERTHALAALTVAGLRQQGFEVSTEAFFDTFRVSVPDAAALRQRLEGAGINVRYFANGTVGIAFDETKTVADVQELLGLFAAGSPPDLASLEDGLQTAIPAPLQRSSPYLTHPVFSSYHSEHEMLRYLKRLENKDLSMVHSMISLGSCTMKLNATAEMIPVTWPEIGRLHPFVPTDQAAGYTAFIGELSDWLCEITGFAAMSLQPNSGAQGEYAGLMVIRAYHQSRGDHHRNVALIPASAHGTNPASAVMAGMKVVVTKTDANGNIDVDDLREKAQQHADDLSCLMVTYPSTHGVYEESIREICGIIHTHGGQVYMDGANMNAQVGLTSPAAIGADVCHLNLHKTFCIPHGGGGPGMGPIGVATHLKPFLPGHAVVAGVGGSLAIPAVSAAPYGSASILPISYAYIAMMGGEGLTRATETAILNANYIKARLEGHYDVLYTGSHGRCAHEMILDCRPFKGSAGIEAEDIAKRLMDYGFHAPTLSFPVAGTLMVEPTESESKAELDRFCEAMIGIRNEIREIEEGRADRRDNVLKNAPHTQAVITADDWTHPYTRQQAAYPLPYVAQAKFWPSVSRVDSAYGDRNLICACPPVEAYQEV